MRIKDIRYRIVSTRVSYNLRKEPSLILTSEIVGCKTATEQTLQKQMDDMLSVLNQDNKNANQPLEWQIIPCPNNPEIYMLLKYKNERSHYIKGYFSIHELHPGIALRPHVIRIWDYRGYTITEDSKSHKFIIKHIDKDIDIRYSLDDALTFIDKRMGEERVRNDGPVYYAG